MTAAAVDRVPAKTPGRMVALAGFLAGFALVGLGVWSWQLPREEIIPGADVKVDAGASGGLELIGSDSNVIGASDLRPGQETSGVVRVRNTTQAPISFQVFAQTSSAQANQLLQLYVKRDRLVVAQGTLAELSKGSPPMDLAPGAETALDLTLLLPAGVDDRYEGVLKKVEVRLAPVTSNLEVQP